jgi:hypothetical protein
MLWADPYEDNKADSSFGKIILASSSGRASHIAVSNGANRLQSPKRFQKVEFCVKPTEIEIDGIAKIKAN